MNVDSSEPTGSHEQLPEGYTQFQYQIDEMLENTFDLKASFGFPPAKNKSPITRKGLNCIYKASRRKIDHVVLGVDVNPVDLPNGGKTMGLFFNVEELKIFDKAKKPDLLHKPQEFDLLQVVPEGFKVQMVEPASISFIAPEVLTGLLNLNHLDFHYNTDMKIKGNLLIPAMTKDNLDIQPDFVEVFIWNILTARYLKQNGQPISQPEMNKLSTKVQDRRQSIFNLLNEGKTLSELKVLFEMNF